MNKVSANRLFCFTGGNMTEIELNKALECAEWIKQYSNSMAKVTADTIIKLVNEIKQLQEQSAKDQRYITWQQSEVEYIQQSTYNCGEL